MAPQNDRVVLVVVQLPTALFDDLARAVGILGGDDNVESAVFVLRLPELFNGLEVEGFYPGLDDCCDLVGKLESGGVHSCYMNYSWLRQLLSGREVWISFSML